MAQSWLEAAASLVSGERQQTYGDITKSFTRIAQLWGSYLGHPIAVHDVVNLMILLKVSRAHDTPHSDSYVDVAGYVECLYRIINPQVSSTGSAESPLLPYNSTPSMTTRANGE